MRPGTVGSSDFNISSGIDSTRMTIIACMAILTSIIIPGVLITHWVPRAGWGWLVWILFWIWVAARQHSLYVLNHEASHGLLFEVSGFDSKVERKNRLFAEVFCLWPFFHHPEAFSFVLWRRVHRLHHAHLFTADDPNFVGRSNQGQTQHPLSNLEIAKSCARAPWDALRNMLMGEQDYVGPDESRSWNQRRVGHWRILLDWNGLHREDAELGGEQRRKLIVLLMSLSILTMIGWEWHLFWLWIVPMWTVYPMILRWNDLTEHNWSEKSSDLRAQTNSRADKWWTLLFLSDLGRHFHWEHHLNPKVPWWKMRSYARQLAASGRSDEGP